MVLRQVEKKYSQDCAKIGLVAVHRSATYLALQNGLTEENVPEIFRQLSQYPVSFGKAANG